MRDSGVFKIVTTFSLNKGNAFFEFLKIYFLAFYLVCDFQAMKVINIIKLKEEIDY